MRAVINGYIIFFDNDRSNKPNNRSRRTTPLINMTNDVIKSAMSKLSTARAKTELFLFLARQISISCMVLAMNPSSPAAVSEQAEK